MNRLPVKSFQDLIVWQKAHQWVLFIYRYSDDFPQREIYVLTSQLRRSAISIPANIAEGFKKRGKRDKGRYYLILAKDLGYGNCSQLISQLEEVSKLLERYSNSILNSDS